MKPTINVKDVALALVRTAKDRDAIAQTVKDLMLAQDALLAHPDVVVGLQEAAVPIGIRQKVLRDALKGEVHATVLNALLILQQAHALHLLPTFTDAVKSAAETEGHHVAHVTVAEQLGKSDRSDLEKTLVKRFGGTVDLKEAVDPGIIGGMVVRVGEWQCDASVRGTLERLNQHLYV